MLCYRVVVDGRLTPRLAMGLAGVRVEPRADATELVAELSGARELDGLLQRIGDLGLVVVSLAQEPAPR